eukprot:6175811-Pleurochrysis_carterae.AAC.4
MESGCAQRAASASETKSRASSALKLPCTRTCMWTQRSSSSCANDLSASNESSSLLATSSDVLVRLLFEVVAVPPSEHVALEEEAVLAQPRLGELLHHLAQQHGQLVRVAAEHHAQADVAVVDAVVQPGELRMV